ncbi:SPOR domain-containing protein [Rhodanobacter lindaniclasticus]|uniref:Sporulation protein n=1 Tax=Rhodanobacter lindaniclasticus TaxID=75310 RepID=A0A4S3KM83_9GAMM|nr:SPOR domain-containing protein [Rhodanobacter lindaniclasticus]THD09992.1 sporulation protein [Rhodanobacter lindaniclasticus]
MKTRLLGAAVLIALAVIFVPMFFTDSPPTPGGDQSVSLAIPPAPDRDLQTRTMSLDPSAAASVPAGATTAAGAAVSGDRIATVTIDSNRPRDVELDPEAGRTPAPTTVTTGSGTSPAQPVIPQRDTGTAATPKAVAAAKPAPASEPSKPAAKPAELTPATVAASAAHGSYTINLSAYASASGAAKLQSRVRALGYPVSGRVITRAGQSRTLVTAGPFETRTAAEAARLKITQAIPGVPAKVEQDADVSGTSTPTTSTTTHTARAGGWAVQLAAVSSQADAIALRDKLRAAGFDGFVDSVQSGGRTLWRVRAGPQTQRADAQRVHDQIKAKLGMDGNVVSVP